MNIPDFIPVLGRMNHTSPEDGACIMEMVSFLAGESWTDHPKCVSDYLTSLAISVNDWVSEDNRNKIARMAPKFIGTDKVNTVEVTEEWEKRYADKYAKFNSDNSNFANWPTPISGAFSAIVQHHQYAETGRLTNEEYDNAGIDLLEEVVDLYREIGNLNEPDVDVSKFAEHPSQVKANA